MSMSEHQPEVRKVPPLPATTEELMKLRKLKNKPTLNEMVEQVVQQLWENREFTQYIEGVYDSDTVEGSELIDDVKAAEIIRNAAKKAEITELANKKLDAVVRSMRVVLRRFNQDRNYRRGDRTDD